VRTHLLAFGAETCFLEHAAVLQPRRSTDLELRRDLLGRRIDEAVLVGELEHPHVRREGSGANHRRRAGELLDGDRADPSFDVSGRPPVLLTLVRADVGPRVSPLRTRSPIDSRSTRSRPLSIALAEVVRAVRWLAYVRS
jgi:hypothetical protein